MPEASTDELINLLLSQSSDDTSYERRMEFANLKQKYFDSLTKNDPKYINDQAGASEEAARMAARAMNLPVTPSADDGSINLEPSEG